eukprot:31003-Pelagococcus_subviridis.AAC.13
MYRRSLGSTASPHSYVRSRKSSIARVACPAAFECASAHARRNRAVSCAARSELDDAATAEGGDATRGKA